MPQNPFQTIRFATPFLLMPARSIPIHGNLHYTPDKELISIPHVIYNNSQTGPISSSKISQLSDMRMSEK